MKLLAGKRALITGASRGIGSAVAKAFAAQGANLVLLARREDLLSQLQNELSTQYDIEVVIAIVDLNDTQKLKEMFAQLSKDNKIIDILVNNAGVMRDATLQMAKDEMMYEVINTNLMGTIQCSKYALKHFIKNKGGVVINLSSIIGTNGNLGQTIYSASKAGVIGFTKSLAKELAPLNIRVNAIAPGFIDTDMTRGMDAKFYEKNLASIGMKRIGKPNDIAQVAVFLACDMSAYVTGQILGVDGGMII